MWSVQVRRSARGFPGLSRSRSVSVQQRVWMSSRKVTQVWNVDSLGNILVGGALKRVEG